MVNLLAAWLLFPAALAGICLGCGLLLERLSGRDLPGVLLLPVGFALTLVVARFLTDREASAGLAFPLLLLLAAGGLLLGFKRLRRTRVDGWVAASALGVFAVYGAPVFLSGEPTFAGYVLLPDTANQLALAAFTAEHGHNLAALGALPSSYQSALTKYLTSSYPVASQSALGVLSPLGGLDTVWLYQPFLTFSAALSALGLNGLLADAIRPSRWRAAACFVAAQPALAVSYALQGSIKELTGVAVLVLVVALVALALRERWPVRGLVLVAVASAAALGALGVAAAAFLAPVLALLLVVWLVTAIRARRLSELAWGLGVIGAGALAALPVLSGASTALTTARVVLTNTKELGNLAAPLHVWQAAGVWLNGDYRYAPATTADHSGFLLAALMAVAALIGIGWAARHRLVGAMLLPLTFLPVGVFLVRRGTPYADAKVLMVISVAVVASAALGLWAARGLARGVPALLLAALLSCGILFSNALAYHDVQLAPHGRFDELLGIDSRLAGKGPAILNEYDEFGMYLLRRAPGWNEPEHTPSYVMPPRPTHPSRRPYLKMPFDADDVTLQYLQSARYLVYRRSPLSSRPPASFELVSRGRWYDVWRPGRDLVVAQHVPAGTLMQPSGRLPCRVIARLAARARRLGGRVAYVNRPPVPSLVPERVPHSPTWTAFGPWPGSLVLAAPGEADGRVRLPAAGRFELWLEGSFGRPVTVEVDGRQVGSVRYAQNLPGGFERVTVAAWRGGVHRVRIRQGGGSLHPASGGEESSLRHVGTLAFAPVEAERDRVQSTTPGNARALCGRRVDWVEAVVPGPGAPTR